MKGLVDRATKESCSSMELKKEILNNDGGKLMASCLEHRSTKNTTKITTDNYELAEVVGQGSKIRASGIRGHAESVEN